MQISRRLYAYKCSSGSQALAAKNSCPIVLGSVVLQLYADEYEYTNAVNRQFGDVKKTNQNNLLNYTFYFL